MEYWHGYVSGFLGAGLIALWLFYMLRKVDGRSMWSDAVSFIRHKS